MSGNTQPTDQQSTNNTTTAPANTVPDSVQQRFNELTAKIHSMAESQSQTAAINEALMAQNAKLTEQMLAMQNQSHGGPALPPLPEGVEPSLVDAIAARIMTPMQKQLAQIQNQFQATLGNVAGQQEQMQLQAAIASESPEVQKQVMKLHAEVKQRGYTGWTPQNLVWMARGMVAQGARPNPSDVTVPSSGAPVPSTTTGPVRKTEQELAAMSSDQRLAYYESLPGVTGDIQY